MFLILLFLAADTTLISYEAKKITYNFRDSIIILSDSAQVRYGDLTLYADTCEYYYNKNFFISFPKSTIIQGSDSLTGTICRYNTETKVAMIKNGRANVEKGYLYGDEVWLVGEHEFNVKNGRYTTCEHDPPHYYFYAPRMKVYLDDISIGEPVILTVRGIPILAAPFWFVPISEHRKSGLTPFRAGRSNTEGEYIKDFSYYLVINDYADITFTTDIMRKKGIRPKINLVYSYNPYSEGNWFGSYIYETDTRRRRYSINGYNWTDRFFFKSQMTARVDYQSDESYVQEYAEEKPLLLQREFYSHLTVSKDIYRTKNNIRVERRVDYADTTTTDRLPRYDLSFPTINIMEVVSTPNFFFIREIQDSEKTMAADLKVPVTTTIPISLFTYNPSVNFDLGGYAEDTLGRRFPYRLGYSTSHQLTTTFFRLFPFEFFGLSGLLHRVVPRIGYQYTPEIADLDVRPVGGIGGFHKQSSVFFSLDNNFETKFHDQRITLFNINGSIGYNLLNDSLSTGNVNLYSRPNSNIDILASFQINPYTREVTKSFSEGLKIKAPYVTIGINHSYSDLSHQLWSTIQPDEFLGIDLSAGARYDINEKKLIEYSVNLIKDLHCWELLFNYAKLGTEWRYDFKIRIKKIPEIEIGKGILGILPE